MLLYQMYVCTYKQDYLNQHYVIITQSNSSKFQTDRTINAKLQRLSQFRAALVLLSAIFSEKLLIP